jgi:hypothetical protein
VARLGFFDDLVPTQSRGGRLGLFDDLMPPGVGGLPIDASPMDYATQSLTAAEAGNAPQPRPRGGGVLEQMVEEGSLAQPPAPAVTSAQPPAPTTPMGRATDLVADAYTGAFGGHDPVGEVFDRVIVPFLPGNEPPTTPTGIEEQQWRDQRGGLERVTDATAYGASLPIRLATRGQYGAGDVLSGLGAEQAGQYASQAEADFTRANQDQLAAVQWVGEGALGATGASLAPMAARNPRPPVVEGAPPPVYGASARGPAPRVEPTFEAPPQMAGAPSPTVPPGAPPTLPPQTRGLPPPQSPQMLPAPGPQAQPGVPVWGQPGAPVGPSPQVASMPTSNTARARAYVRKLDDLGIPRYGPAIAQAAREGEGMGVLTRMVQNVPLAGRPIEQGGIDFYGAATRVADDIGARYSREGGNPERVGEIVRDYLEAFKDKPSIARDVIRNMPDNELAVLAERAPRDIGSLPTAAAAWYERAWRNIPVEYRRGGTHEDNPALKGAMPKTAAVLRRIHDDNMRMTNRSRLSQYKGTKNDPEAPAGVLPTPQGGLYKDAIPFRGGIVGQAIEAILDGRWRGSLQTMRNVRSEIRRSESRMADTEGNARNLANYEAIYDAMQRDISDLMTRIANDFETGKKAKKSEPAIVADPAMAERFRAAKRGMDVADRRYREYKTALDEIKSIMKVNTDMKMLDGIIAAATSKGRMDSNALLRIRQIAPDAVLDDIAAGVLNRIGQPTGRASAATQEAGFSLGRAVANWNSMGARQRQLIWGHRPQHYQRLNEFFDVARGMAEYEKMVNTSKSGQHVIAALMAAGGLTALSSIAGITDALLIGAGAYGAARWLTSPAYVAWLTKSLRIRKAAISGQMRPVAAQAAAQRHRNALIRLIKADKSIDPEEAQNVLRAIGAAGDDPSESAQE